MFLLPLKLIQEKCENNSEVPQPKNKNQLMLCAREQKIFGYVYIDYVKQHLLFIILK